MVMQMFLQDLEKYNAFDYIFGILNFIVNTLQSIQSKN